MTMTFSIEQMKALDCRCDKCPRPAGFNVQFGGARWFLCLSHTRRVVESVATMLGTAKVTVSV